MLESVVVDYAEPTGADYSIVDARFKRVASGTASGLRRNEKINSGRAPVNDPQHVASVLACATLGRVGAVDQQACGVGTAALRCLLLRRLPHFEAVSLHGRDNF